jgi:hypothetical protein
MSIQALWLKFKGFTAHPEILLTILIIVVSGLSFILGRISVTEHHLIAEKTPIHMNADRVPTTSTTTLQNTASTTTTPTTAPLPLVNNEKYVASKNGTKYHLPWCTGAKQINEENKIWFATKEEAEKAGYTPASNCKGI